RQDLIVSQNTGEVEIFRNLGNGRFEAKPTRSGYGFWMGLGVGDFDADGDQDLFFSNLGVSILAFLTKGDLKEGQRHAPEWLLLRNDGGFKFTDVTRQYGLTGYGFSWGAVFEDLNLDGRLDLAVAQNYIKWPLHKLAPLGSKTFLQQPDGAKPGFYHTDAFGLDNRHFAQSPLIADLNSDGRPDMLWLNMAGPLRAFLITSNSNFLAIAMPDTLAYLGASVAVETDGGALYTRQVMGSIGLMTDQTPKLFFGLGEAENVKRVRIETADGKRFTAEAPRVNRTLRLGDFTEQP
ncbi:MAG: CRTAC1 family protein, partial [Methyloligellaceae bacterium]